MKKIKCEICKKVEEHRARGLCPSCYRKEYYAKNLKKMREYNNKYNKQEKAKVRRRGTMRKWREKNPEKTRVFAIKWYYENREIRDLAKSNYYHKAKILGKLKRYKDYDKNTRSRWTAVGSAMSRALVSGRKGRVESDKETIIKDIQVLRKEILRLKNKHKIQNKSSVFVEDKFKNSNRINFLW